MANKASMRSDGKGPITLDFEQMKKIKMLLEASGNSDLLNDGETTTQDYDTMADRNKDAAILVIVMFWGFIIVLLSVLAFIGVKTYCTMWERPRRLGQVTTEVTMAMIKPR